MTPLLRAFAILALLCTGCDGTVTVDDDVTGDDDTSDDDDDGGEVTTWIGSPGGPGHADGVGDQARFFHPYGVTWHDDRLWVGDRLGHTIRVFDPDSGEVTTMAGTAGEAGHQDGPVSRFTEPCGLEFGPDGLLYVADRGNGAIRVVDPADGSVSTVAEVLADELFDVAFGEGSTLYFTDVRGCSIRSVDVETGDVAIVAGVNGQCWPQDGTLQSARIGAPRDIVFHPEGVLYYVDRMGDNVRRIDLVAGTVATVFGSADGTEAGYVDAPGTAARFSEPSGLELVGDVLYLTDSDNDGVRRLDLATGEVDTYAGHGINGNADGPLDEASFAWPIGLATDDDGGLYVADAGGHCIRYLAGGEATTVAGTVGNTGSVGGVGTEVRMTEPRALARGEDSTVWLADASNLQVRTLDLDTATVETVAGAPLEYAHLDGVGEDARFMTVSGIAWAYGKVWVAETASHTIRTVDPVTAEVETVVGVPMAAGWQDGTGDEARLNQPRGLTVGGNGLLYLADTGNRAVRRLDPATLELTTLVSPSDPDNPFATPEALVEDGDGTLYVTDFGRCVLVAVDRASGAFEVLAGDPDDCDEVDGVGTAARLDHPRGLDIDPTTGWIFITSYDGHTVRIYAPATTELWTFTGDPAVLDPMDGPLDQATNPSPIDLQVTDDALLLLDLYGAHIRRIPLP